MISASSGDVNAVAVGDNYLNASFIGAPFSVLLSNGYEIYTDLDSQKTHIKIHDLPGLVGAIVRGRLLNPRKLTHHDLKFIRSALSMSTENLAKFTNLMLEDYVLFESGTRIFSPTQEKYYRAAAFLMITASGIAPAEFANAKKQKKVSPKAAMVALKGFHEIFFNMEIISVHEPDYVLEIRLKRCTSNNIDDQSDSDGDWDNDSCFAA